mgnify:FL=1
MSLKQFCMGFAVAFLCLASREVDAETFEQQVLQANEQAVGAALQLQQNIAASQAKQPRASDVINQSGSKTGEVEWREKYKYGVAGVFNPNAGGK